MNTLCPGRFHTRAVSASQPFQPRPQMSSARSFINFCIAFTRKPFPTGSGRPHPQTPVHATEWLPFPQTPPHCQVVLTQQLGGPLPSSTFPDHLALRPQPPAPQHLPRPPCPAPTAPCAHSPLPSSTFPDHPALRPQPPAPSAPCPPAPSQTTPPCAHSPLPSSTFPDHPALRPQPPALQHLPRPPCPAPTAPCAHSPLRPQPPALQHLPRPPRPAPKAPCPPAPSQTTPPCAHSPLRMCLTGLGLATERVPAPRRLACPPLSRAEQWGSRREAGARGPGLPDPTQPGLLRPGSQERPGRPGSQRRGPLPPPLGLGAGPWGRPASGGVPRPRWWRSRPSPGRLRAPGPRGSFRSGPWCRPPRARWGCPAAPTGRRVLGRPCPPPVATATLGRCGRRGGPRPQSPPPGPRLPERAAPDFRPAVPERAGALPACRVGPTGRRGARPGPGRAGGEGPGQGRPRDPRGGANEARGARGAGRGARGARCGRSPEPAAPRGARGGRRRERSPRPRAPAGRAAL
ncbi:vegetative cell wall protein gp1-like [Dipodomys spectabilis]|uniref:vegetative cell wall protein gp1-like n=1 Tax=Dipodomys spectabilis TaxID=105255 RepID=UPI001C53F759|nr:vegetative cell wall protein gp1-like [Dipodomys spectabilis]